VGRGQGGVPSLRLRHALTRGLFRRRKWSGAARSHYVWSSGLPPGFAPRNDERARVIAAPMGMLSAEEWGIVALSLKVSGVAIVVALPIAFGLAWLLARGRFPGKILLDALVHLPLVLPPVVTGWMLLLAFGAKGPAGRFFAEVL